MTLDPDAVEAAEQNYFAAWRLPVDRAEGCLFEETDDVLFTFVPNSVPYFNSAFVKPPANPLTCVATIKEFFSARRTTFTLRFRTMALGFGMPVELTGRLFSPALLESTEYAAFNAYLDGEVASTAALIASGPVAGVYNVATPEPFRRRGLGEATTRAVIAEGRSRGCVTSTLQSSEMGYPIYERMGFRTVVDWLSLTGS